MSKAWAEAPASGERAGSSSTNYPACKGERPAMSLPSSSSGKFISKIKARGAEEMAQLLKYSLW